MLFLTESYGYLNEEQLMQYRGAQFDSVFKKVDIYNRNIRLGKVVEGAYQNGNIVFTLDERAAIKDMLHMVQKNLLEGYAKENHIELNELNEDGFFSKITDKLSGAWKDAMDFVTRMIKQGISTVKDFLKFFIQFFEKLGENANDCIRKALKKLNVFGDDEELDNSAEDQETSANVDSSTGANESYLNIFTNGLFEAEEEGLKISIEDEKLPDISKLDDNFNDIASGKKEKSFLECVAEYVQEKVAGKQHVEELEESYMYNEDGTLNEGKAAEWFQSKLANNKLYQSIVGSKAGLWIKKIGSIWGTFMLGAVGSTICYTIVPLFLDVLKIAFPAVGGLLIFLKWCVKLGYLGWQVSKIIRNRKKQVQNTGEKFISFGFCIQLIMTVGFFIASQTGAVTKVFGHLGQSPFGAKVVEILMWPVKGLLKITGVEFVTTHLSTICGKLINDMAVKFAEKGVGDFAGMSAQVFSETMSKLFASYNLSWKGITGGNTGNIPAEVGQDEMMRIEDRNGINQAAKDAIKGHADQVRHNGGNQKALGDVKWEANGADGTKVVMQNAGEGGRVDAVIMDPRGVEGGKWLHFKGFSDQLSAHGLQMDMHGTEGLKIFTRADGAPLTTEDLGFIKHLMGQLVDAGNLASASHTFLPMTVDHLVSTPTPVANITEPLINIPAMTFAKKVEKVEPNDIVVILGTNTAEWGPYAKEAMRLSKIEDMSMTDAIGQISGDGKSNVEEVGKYLQDLIAKVNKANGVNEAEEEQKKVELKDHHCAILYVKKDDKDVPAVLFDYETMLAVDLIKQPGRKEIRKNPYYFAGLFGSLFMRPSYDMNQLKNEWLPKWFHIHDVQKSAAAARSVIADILCSLVAKGVKANFDLIGKNFVKYDEESKKYIKNPEVEADGPIPQLGNCTIEQYLAVLNTKIDGSVNNENIKPLMNILSAGNKRDVNMFIKGSLPAFDENGLSQGSKKAKNTHLETKEEQDKYIKNVIYPNINNHDGEFYKELTSGKYKQVAKWILDDDKNINMDVLNSEKVSKYILRTEQSYELDTKRNWKDLMKSVIKDQDASDEKVENQNIQVLVSLIWKHYKEFKFNDQKLIDKWGYKGDDKDKSEETSKQEDNAKEVENKDKSEEKPEEKPEEKKDEEKPEEKKDESPAAQETKEETPKGTENNKSKSDAWFEKVVTSRINKPTKTLYKELLANETIKKYYRLSEEKANIDTINIDKALHFVLYNRFKTGKQPSESYWTKKVPALIMKMQKASKHEVNEEKATKKAQVIKEFYNIINKYARRDRDKDTKKLWKKMQTEKLNLAYILKHYHMI